MSNNIIITLEEHNRKWAEYFLQEKNTLASLFNNASLDNLIDIIHIGSTAIQGLIAKPIIDMILIFKNDEHLRDILTQAGYHYKGEYNIPMRQLYGKKIDNYQIYLHAYEAGHPEIKLNIMFRDYINSNIEAKIEYGNLKKAIITHDNMHLKTDSTGITTYNLRKNNFIQKILRAAGFAELCMRIATHKQELDFFYQIKKNCNDKYNDSENFKGEKKNLILYNGWELVSATEIEISNNQTIIKFLASRIDIEQEQKIFYEKFLLQQIQKWLVSIQR
jgi:GrpB-like predicted nucleotidyltransferase (UPF0157 family)